MPLVTLIGQALAKEGNEFIYCGPTPDCRNCKLKTVCFNLKTGRWYRITKVRNKQHTCTVHEGNVAVVEVEEMSITAAIPKKLSQGTTAQIDTVDCNHVGCPHYTLCHNRALQSTKKYKIIKIHETLDCQKGEALCRAELSD